MSSQRITAVVSMTILFTAGLYSQPLPTNDPSERAVSSRPVGNADLTEASAAADDDSDSSDDFKLLDCTASHLIAQAILPNSVMHAASFLPANPWTAPTLKSQHILLRL